MSTSSTLVSKNVKVNGVRTSIRLEPDMWDALADICQRERLSRNQLVSLIDRCRRQSSLTAGMRVFIMNYFRQAATESGHSAAGHAAGDSNLVLRTLAPAAGSGRDTAPLPQAASSAIR